MSRIGKLPIPVPSGVTVTIDGTNIAVKGPKGELKRTLRPEIALKQEEGKILVTIPKDDRISRSLHGLSRTLVANMVKGVTDGFSKKLFIVGVGYRAAMEGKNMVLQLGYSHPVVIEPMQGIELSVFKNTELTVTGIDKQTVGDQAAFIREKRPPEVYKGKGVKYDGELIRRKAGKAAGKKK
jgi:large subunit ribosomal protein L6